MADSLDIFNNLQRLNIPAVASAALEESEGAMADLIAGQLAQGRRGDGSEILPAYTQLTVELKKDKQGLAGVTDHVTLYDTGSHYKQLYADVQGVDLEIGSSDKKSASLEKKYGTKKGSIYDLTTDSKDELVSGPVGASWERIIEEETGLNFK